MKASPPCAGAVGAGLGLPPVAPTGSTPPALPLGAGVAVAGALPPAEGRLLGAPDGPADPVGPAPGAVTGAPGVAPPAGAVLVAAFTGPVAGAVAEGAAGRWPGRSAPPWARRGSAGRR